MSVTGKQLQLSPWEHDSGHHGRASLRRVLLSAWGRAAECGLGDAKGPCPGKKMATSSPGGFLEGQQKHLLDT